MKQEIAELIAVFTENVGKGNSRIPPQASNELYLMAYNFYNNGKYDEAQNCFRTLVTIDAYQVDYWIGLGASLQMLKEYQEAIAAYAIASLIDAKNPIAHFHAAECFFALQMKAQGLNALENAEQLSKGKEKYSQLMARIVLMRQSSREQKQES